MIGAPDVVAISSNVERLVARAGDVVLAIEITSQTEVEYRRQDPGAPMVWASELRLAK